MATKYKVDGEILEVTEEVTEKYEKDSLTAKKANHQQQIDWIDELLAEFDK